MKITPINLYVTNNNFKIKKKLIINFGNDIAKRTSEPNLSTYIPLMSTKLKLDENLKFFLTGINKVDTDTKREGKPLEIADIGCCDGALFRSISDFLPQNTKYFGLDLSQGMLNEAAEKDKGKINSTYILGNAFNLPFKESKKDVIIASSIMHELYSYESKEYNEKPYSKESILHFMQDAYNCLKPGGVLIIKDPATEGVDPFEKIKITNANKEDGNYPPLPENELVKADITKLCTYDKLRRFCTDFYPAKNQISWDENGDCIMPRWLVTEFVRHRKWLATPENWEYEIKENYGTLRPDEVADFAHKTGFYPIKIENISIPNKNNIYAIKEGEFELKDMNDNILSLEDFPMFLEIILRKPRNENKIK